MPNSDFTLDLDRSRPETLRQQACSSIVQAIKEGRQGFARGDRLTSLRLSRHNQIHRNTVLQALNDLVRAGYLRRLPNRGFEVVDKNPKRPDQLTKHILSISDVAKRHNLQTRSKLIPEACAILPARDLKGHLARVKQDLRLAPEDTVSALARCIQVKRPQARQWSLAAIEQTYITTALVPDFLQAAQHTIRQQGDFSVYLRLRRAFPNDEFFKAQYEISLLALPDALTQYWTSQTEPMNVLTVTYCSEGPVEVTYTWFDSTRAILLASSLDVELT